MAKNKDQIMFLSLVFSIYVKRKYRLMTVNVTAIAYPLAREKKSSK
jgi:hypothetical protein